MFSFTFIIFNANVQYINRNLNQSLISYEMEINNCAIVFLQQELVLAKKRHACLFTKHMHQKIWQYVYQRCIFFFAVSVVCVFVSFDCPHTSPRLLLPPTAT